MAWSNVGTLSQLVDLVKTDYPLTHFEYGIKYNHGIGAIHPVVINGWNVGVRVSVAPAYPQGDTSTAMTFGTTVFAKGLNDCDDGQWHHQYYQGGKAGGGSNGIAAPSLYARRLPCPWTQVGDLSQLERLAESDYPCTHYEYGIKYNNGIGAIHAVVINGWNRGVRVSAAPEYPQGDTSAGMTFGTAVFTKGLADQDDGKWHHHYYRGGKAAGGSNGVVTPDLYVRRFPAFALEEKEQEKLAIEREKEQEKLAIEREKEQLQAEVRRLQAAAVVATEEGAQERLAIERETEQLRAEVRRLQAAAAAGEGTIQALRSQNAAFRDEFRRQRAFSDTALADDQQSSP